MAAAVQRKEDNSIDFEFYNNTITMKEMYIAGLEDAKSICIACNSQRGNETEITRFIEETIERVKS